MLVNALFLARGGGPELGGWALGVFVGVLVGIPLLAVVGLLGTGLVVAARSQLRYVIVGVTAVLSGAPVIFLGDTSAKWLYPVGLLGGLALLRIYAARLAIAKSRARPGRANRVMASFAWMDLVFIAIFLLSCGAYAALS